MGVLIDGSWHDEEFVDEIRRSGEFVRSESTFREWISSDGSSGLPAEAGRYHLYLSLACPWASRTLVFRKLKKLEQALRPPKARGGFGELLLENLLRDRLPPTAFALQHGFAGGERVDAVIKVDRIVPIDSKFPLDNFERMLAADNDIERQQHEKLFARDVKTHVDAIAGKYIRPDEGTYDFALMYIPVSPRTTRIRMRMFYYRGRRRGPFPWLLSKFTQRESHTTMALPFTWLMGTNPQKRLSFEKSRPNATLATPELKLLGSRAPDPVW